MNIKGGTIMENSDKGGVSFLNQKMTRKQFIGTVAGGVLGALGVLRVVKDVSDHLAGEQAGSYGDGVYGGVHNAPDLTDKPQGS